MKRTIIVLILILSCMPYVPIKAQPEETPKYFEYPTETWIIESQDYFGAWLEWTFIPVGGQAGDKREWNFTWTMKDFNFEENGTANPIYEIREADGNQTKLREIYNRTEPLQFKTWGDFISDVSRLDRYPITPEDKEEFTGLKANIDLFNEDTGSFQVAFKDRWKPGKKITIGFGSTITYSGATNTITCTGGTEESPITFWDLWNASNVLGWDVVNNTCDTQFKFWCKIQFGDDVTETYFGDEGKQVTFVSGIATGTWYIYNDVRTDATVRLGELTNEDIKSVKNGCMVKLLEENYEAVKLFTMRVDSTILLYGCSFYGVDVIGAPRDRHYAVSSSTGTSRIWGCLFGDNMGLTLTQDEGPDMDRCIFLSSLYVLRALTMTSVRTSNIFLIGHGAGPVFHGGTGDYVLKDVFIRDSWKYVAEFPGGSSGSLSAINWDVDDWRVIFNVDTSTAKLYRQYTFNIKICDNAGDLIEDAEITITYSGAGGGTIGPLTTFPNGTIPEQVLTKGLYNETYEDRDLLLYEPYTLTITKDGYIDYSVSFNISEPISWTVGLEPLDVIFSMELLVLAAVSMIFMLMMLFSSQPGMGVISGTLAFMFWFATGMYYMYTNIADQYAIGYLFIGLGLICGIFTVYCGLKTLDPKASKDSDFL